MGAQKEGTPWWGSTEKASLDGAHKAGIPSEREPAETRFRSTMLSRFVVSSQRNGCFFESTRFAYTEPSFLKVSEMLFSSRRNDNLF